MDPINERKMFQQLVRAASKPNTPQWVLTTITRSFQFCRLKFDMKTWWIHVTFVILQSVNAFLLGKWPLILCRCFLLTPKLLPDLEYSEACSILNVMNGPWIEQPSKSNFSYQKLHLCSFLLLILLTIHFLFVN
jgi:hypothetical protein